MYLYLSFHIGGLSISSGKIMNSASSELALSNEKDKSDTSIAENHESDITLDATLRYLSSILLEESTDEDDDDIAVKEATNLQALEKHFADIIGQKHPHSQDSSSLKYAHPRKEHPTSTNELSQEHSKPTLKNIPALEYSKGVEEGKKFVPSIEKVMLDFQGRKLSFPFPSQEEYKDTHHVIKGSNGKTKLGNGIPDPSEGRNRKISVSYSGEPVRDAKLDEVILSFDDYYKKEKYSLSEGTSRGEGAKKLNIDFEDHLISCSRLVAGNNHQAAREIIEEIRKQASPDRDWSQRLALEARLTGTGMDLYNQCIARRILTSDIVKVQYLLMTVSPILGCTYYITKETILGSMKKKKAHKLHIIDFGILFGFQWPSLIQGLSEWKGKGDGIELKITRIDFPCSGFRPSEQVDESGRRLKEYARSFGVRFEYHGIASRWEDIRIEDLGIENDELLIVNSIKQFRKLEDGTVALDCPRNRVLNLIQRLKPHPFLHGTEIATFSPFFVTRFKQVMLHYGAMYDILDAFIPPTNAVGLLVERDILAREVINLVACEGSACVEKPETYKQWHMRNLRAGFEQIEVDPTIVEMCKKKYREIQDKRYFIEEENGWLLQGWRGRATFAISIWRPKKALQ